MFDDLRQQAEQGSFEPEEEEDAFAALERPAPRRQFLGMLPWQRFFIALMLLLMTCILGTLFLLVTGKIVPQL